MPQTSVSDVVAYSGQIADGDFPSSFISGTNVEGSAIPFGIAVTRASSQSENYTDDVEEFDAAADEIVGVTVRSHSLASDDLAGSDAIADNQKCSIMSKGRVWVTVEEAVTKGDPVYVRFTSDGGSNTQLGTFRKSIDSSRARRFRGARYASSASAGGLAVLEFDASLEDVPETFTMAYNEIAQVTSDTTRALFNVPADKFFVLTAASVRNVTGLAADASNYFNIKVQDGTPTVLANWSTLSTAEGALSAATVHAMTLGTLAQRTLAPGSKVDLFIDETGTATLPADTVVTVEGYFL